MSSRADAVNTLSTRLARKRRHSCTSPPHIPALDGFRGLAILQVLIYHYIILQSEPTPGSIFSYLRLPFEMTWAGVDMFFVLSGFLITSVLLQSKGHPDYFRRFYMRRVFRIFPLYFAVIFILIGLNVSPAPQFASIYADPMPLWSYFVFGQNFFNAVEGRFGPYLVGVTWSLAVEEQFYLVLPALVAAASRRTFACAIVFMLLAAPALRALDPGMGAYVLPWCRADSLMVGVLAALALDDADWRQRILDRPWALNIACVLLLLATASLLFWARWKGGVANHLILSLFFVSLLLLAHLPRHPVSRIVLSMRWLRWLGTRSFGLYLVHDPMNVAIHLTALDAPPTIETGPGMVLTAIALAATCSIVEVSFRHFERPMRRLGRALERPTATTPVRN